MKTRKISIRRKLELYISGLSIICCSFLGFITYHQVSRMMIDQSKESAIGIAEVAAGEIDGNQFGGIKSSEDAYYQTTFDTLHKYKQLDSILYIYTMKLEDNNLIFVVDTDDEDVATYGTPYTWIEDMEPAFAGESCCDSHITSDEWGSYYSAYAPIKDSQGNVMGIVGCDVGVDNIEAQLGMLRRLIILLVVGFDVVCVIAAFIIGSNIGANLNRLFTKVQEMNSGNRDLRKHVDISSGDELEVIAGEFNQFIEHIRGLMEEVSLVSGNVEENSTSLMESVEQCKHQIRRINVALGNMNDNMRETSAGANNIMDNLRLAVDEISDLYHKAQDNSTDAKDISKRALQARKDVETVQRQTDHIIEEMQEGLERAKEECKEIEKIDDITIEILKVANKTQILALNASIEAARAGGFGKGFAVIATDITNLSQQISMLVNNIQETNQSVKQAVGKLTGALENISLFLDQTVANDYKKFVQIGDDYSANMDRMADVLEDFHQVTDSINRSITGIQDNVTKIDRAIGDATQGISELHNRGDKMNSRMVQLSEVAVENTDESKKLNTHVNQYYF